MKLAICEDEKIFQDVLLDYLKPYLSELCDISVDVFSHGADLIERHRGGVKYDMVFLDVDMPEMTGVEVGQALREMDDSVILIFTTSYQEYVRQAFSINAFQYLIKPIMRDVFTDEFERALTRYRKMKYMHQIYCTGKERFIEVKDILFIETYSRHLRLVTHKEKIEYTGRIKEEEHKLADYGFLRCHQGYLINMTYILKPGNSIFVLTENIEIPISRQLKNEAMSKYNKYMSRSCL